MWGSSWQRVCRKNYGMSGWKWQRRVEDWNDYKQTVTGRSSHLKEKTRKKEKKQWLLMLKEASMQRPLGKSENIDAV